MEILNSTWNDKTIVRFTPEPVVLSVRVVSKGSLVLTPVKLYSRNCHLHSILYPQKPHVVMTTRKKENWRAQSNTWDKSVYIY